MTRTPVKSSNLVSIGYDEESKTLEVEFKRNRIYQYWPITRSGYERLMNSESKGSFFNKYIKNQPGINVTEVDELQANGPHV